MNRKIILLIALSSLAPFANAQFDTETRNFPPDGSSFVSGSASVASLGLNWDSFEFASQGSKWQGPPLNAITDPQTTLMPCLMKAKEKANRTKCSNNLRLTFHGTTFTATQEDYDVDADFEGQFDNSVSKIKITGSAPTKHYVGHVTLIKREIRPGTMGYTMTGTLEASMAYSADGTNWVDLDNPVVFNLQASSVPEPATLVGLSAAMLFMSRRRRA